MRIKTKLTLGVGLLFILIVLMTFVGARYIYVLKQETENILKANYNTLEYSRNMLMTLDEIRNTSDALAVFEENLKKQQENITETGEKEMTLQISGHFSRLKNNPSDESIYLLMRKDIFDIMKLNMSAIQRKSNIANETASSAIAWITLTGSICFLIAFFLLIRLPHNIANPIMVLTDSIKQIADRNYKQRVHLDQSDEFGELAASFNIMAEKLQEYNNSNLHGLMFEKKRIEALVNNMKDPVIGLDEGKKVLFVNDQGLKILGLHQEDIVGKSAQDISLKNDLFRLLIQELIISQTKNSLMKKEIKIFMDNKESYFEKEIIDITITPPGENNKLHIGHVIILNNITSFRELELAKTNFIATVSHELKTPISSIKLSLQLLQNNKTGNLNPEQQLLLDSIHDDSNRLLKITGELLSMSQVETGNIQLNIQQSDPLGILDFALEAVKMQAEQKQIQLIADLGENLPKVKADMEKTSWVLINFLTNAIRYSPEQSRIIIHIRIEGDMLLFAVKDNGKGIEARYKDKIFDKYFQVPGSNKTGTGLGLAISKEFIDAQGGKIGVDSEIGMGSNFYFLLPSV
jgi:signal transduction histidine kinase